MSDDDPATVSGRPPAEGVAPTLSPMAPAHPNARDSARAQLRTLRLASAELANALMAAGYPPQRWQAPDPTLRELARALAQPSVAAWLARLDQFSAETGPIWLAGDESQMAEFASEARLLDDLLRPVSALSRRRRSGSPSDHPARPLERVLGDAAVGTHIDRLAEATQALVELALLLPDAPASVPLSSEFEFAQPGADSASALPDTSGRASAAHDGTVPGDDPTPTSTAALHPAFALVTTGTEELTGREAAAALRLESPVDGAASDDLPATVISPTLPTIPTTSPYAASYLRSTPMVAQIAPPDAPTIPLLPSDPTVPLPSGNVPHPTRRALLSPRLVIASALAACIACALAAIILTFAPLPGPSAQATPSVPAMSAAAFPSATSIQPTATPRPAILVVSPTSVNIPCSGSEDAASLIIRDTGGQSLTWRITNPPLTLFFSQTSGTLAPGTASTIQARALFRQRGNHSLTFTSNGGDISINYTVCR